MRFSIVIATHSPGTILSRALDSILNQTFKDYEIVIQDNLSSDDETNQVLEQYQNQIKLIRQKDAGIYDAFNLALTHCSGDWVLFIGADDQLADPTVLETIDSQLNQHANANLLLGSIINQNISGRWVPKTLQSKLTSRIIWKNTVHQQGCLYNRNWLVQHPFPKDLKILGDYAIHLAAYFEKTPYIQTNTTICLCDANGISKKFTKPLYQEERRMKKESLPFHWYVINIPWIGIKYWIKSNF